MIIENLKSLGVKIIPLISFVGLACGAGALTWYAQLSSEDRARADDVAEKYALDLYKKSRSQVTASEAHHIVALTKTHFNNRKDL